MWNSGKDIVWNHTSKITYDGSNRGLKLIPKITDEHVRLTPYSKMNVSLATQVLSKSVSNILYVYYPPETHGTAELCMYMDNFFECLNVRNQYEGIRKKKYSLLPYTDENDVRFEWLSGYLLSGYLHLRSCERHKFTERDCIVFKMRFKRVLQSICLYVCMFHIYMTI